MINRILFLACFSVAGLFGLSTAGAQQMTANVVASCGTTNGTPVAGGQYPLTIDTSGRLCNGGAGVSPTTPTYTAGSYFYDVASTVLTRASNTTAYAANETVCLLASVTPCAPITISIANTNQGKGLINRINLLKSGTSITNATFTVWLFSAAPGVATPAQYDATSYTGPRAADMPNYIGSATCTNPVVTSDTTVQVWYECALSNPNTSGALVFQALSGATTINALISVTAAYTPASAETFTVYASGLY